MARRTALVLAVVLGAAPVRGEAPRKSPENRLAEGRLAYERGDYPLAVVTLTPLLYPSIELASEDAVIEAHRLLALSYLLEKKEPEAAEEATSILALRPSFQLDPIVDPPMAVSFFESVRKRQEARLHDLRERARKDAEARAREDAERRHATAERVYIERTVTRRSRLVATLPFGVGQWQNGQRTKAALFLSSELVFGALSLSGYVALDQKYPYDPSTRKRFYPIAEQTTAQALLGLQLGAGIAFWATVLWGIIDAHVLFKRETVQTREVPRGLKSLMLSPSAAPSGGGLSLQGAF